MAPDYIHILKEKKSPSHKFCPLAFSHYPSSSFFSEFPMNLSTKVNQAEKCKLDLNRRRSISINMQTSENISCEFSPTGEEGGRREKYLGKMGATDFPFKKPQFSSCVNVYYVSQTPALTTKTVIR